MNVNALGREKSRTLGPRQGAVGSRSSSGVKVVDAQDFKPYLLPLMIVNQKSSYLLTVRNPLSPPTCSRILVMAFYSPFDMIS